MTVNIGVVGLGMALKPHLASLEDLSAAGRLTIGGCFTPSAERRQAFAGANPQHPVVDSLDALLNDEAIDALLILTPPHTHLELIEKAAVAGKHVLVEKPLDASVERGQKAIDAMGRAGQTLGIVLQHRFRMASQALAGMIAGGELGDILSASASIRWWRTPEYYAQPGRGMKARDGGGVLLTQAIHTLDLFQSLAGQIVEVTGYATTSSMRTIDTEDVASAALRFANGALGVIDATTVAYPGFPERIEIAGTKASAVLTAETLEVFHKDGRKSGVEGGESKSGGADPMAFSHEAHKAVIADFVDALEQGRQPRIHGQEGLKVQKLIEAILRSAETKTPQAV